MAACFGTRRTKRLDNGERGHPQHNECGPRRFFFPSVFQQIVVTMKKVAIVGCGLVGSGWAIVFARAGMTVSLYDHKPGASQNALAWISDRLDDMKEAGLIDNPDTIRARLTCADTLAQAVADADYIQESVLEVTEVKRSVFTELDDLVQDHTIIGSSTSGIPASQYTDHLRCKARCLVVHPVNPPYLIPVVELVPAPWTDPAVVSQVHALMQQVGQKPITVNKEIDGFVLNRLQGVLLMEAWRLVEEGVVSVADLDLTMSHGLGLRWGFMGPFEAIDLNAEGGVADYARRLGPLYHRIASSRTEFSVWDEDLIAKVEQQRRQHLSMEDLKARSAWRDKKLMLLAREREVAEAQADADAQANGAVQAEADYDTTA